MHDVARVVLARHEHPVDFAPECELAALRAAPATMPPRWQGPQFRSIDAVGTRDLDDAMAFELHQGALRIHIAVAHPPAYFDADSPLFAAAIERGGSVYLPDLTVPMLPAVFGERIAPLSADDERVALITSFDALDDGEIGAISIQLATVRVAENLSYAGADALLESLDAVEQACVTWATRSRALRERNGAIHIEIPRVRVATATESPLTLSCEERASASHRLVAECMVRCNEAFGRYCAANAIAAPFRQRGPFEGTVPSGARSPVDVLAPADEAGVHVAAAMRVLRNFPPASLTFEPAPHRGIGVTAYVQCTSPLRRACDLLAHFQLAAHLAGREPLNAQQLAGPAMAADLAFRRSERIMREVHRAWLVAWHGERLGESFRAWPIDTIDADRFGEVVLEPTWLVGALRLKQGATPGVPVSVVVRGADPERQRLSLCEP
jgi:exoribonuclease-2